MSNLDLQNLTKDIVYSKFHYVNSIFGNLENYHMQIKLFPTSEDEIDLYFKSKDKNIQAYQLETFNDFIKLFKGDEIEKTFMNSFSKNEENLYEKGRISKTYYEILQVPYRNTNYDLILVCSKEYKRFLFSKKQISIRIEFKNGKINSFERKSDTTKENKR